MTKSVAQTSSIELKSYVERIERLNEELKAVNSDKRDLYAEAKSKGFDPIALKEIIKIRAQDPSERSERTAMVETYMAALGMLPSAPVVRAPARVHEEKLKVKPAEPSWTDTSLPADDLSIPKSLQRNTVN